jgi:glutaredoxin
MTPKTRSLIAALALLIPTVFSATSADAQTYRWKDKDGVMHYSDQPPPSGEAEIRKFTDNASDPTLPYALRQTITNFPVKLYTSTACGPICDQARALLSGRSTPYDEVSLDNNEAIDNFHKTFGASTQIPLLSVGSTQIKGFEAGAWNKQLDLVGYPKAKGAQ